MPELPEVENLRMGLEQAILGQKVLNVEVRLAKVISSKGNIRTASKSKVREFENGIKNEKFVAVKRRAKNLIFELTHEKVILAHLKMTGQFVYKGLDKENNVIGGHPIEISESTLPNKHTHIIFKLEKGTLCYNDTRKFGYVLYFKNKKEFEKENHFKDLGKEPLDKEFTKAYFSNKLNTKKSKIKSVLMGQDVVVGVGNIYTDESLFEAGIKPTRPANSLTSKESEALYDAILRILKKAIKTGGSSVATYRLLDESRGNYARLHKVYGKSGSLCINCKNNLETITIQSRTTVFCAHCQK